jgi:endonuclease YncB( thermonuclease family)
MYNKILMVVVLVMTMGFGGSLYASEYPDIEGVTYLRNYDGDTVTVNIDGYPEIIGKKISIRVEGIDTPEIRGKCENEKIEARIVKDFVRQELKNAKDIKIVDVSRGKYFRIVGDFQYDGKSLREQILEKGYGYPYDGGTKSNPWCK